MDPFVRYLIIINVVTLAVFTIDFFLCMWIPELDDTAANSLILDIFPIAGGAAGMLIALFVLGGIGRGHRMNKDNIAWWFLAIICLIVWGFVALTRLGIITPAVSVEGALSGWGLTKLKVLGIYLIAINIATFIAFSWDKAIASTGNDLDKRIPEALLLGICLVGGSVGGFIAMHLVRHKTRKWYFVWGLPVFIVLDIAVVLYAHVSGLF